jgi:hypothetical protein
MRAISTQDTGFQMRVDAGCMLRIGMRHLASACIQINNHKNREHNTGDSVCGHEGEVHLSQIGGLYNGMLVKQHGQEQAGPNPIPATEFTD